MIRQSEGLAVVGEGRQEGGQGREGGDPSLVLLCVGELIYCGGGQREKRQTHKASKRKKQNF